MKCRLLILALACVGLCAKEFTTPVLFIHGCPGDEHDGDVIGSVIEEMHPGQPFYSLAVDNGDKSYKSLYTQLKDYHSAIKSLINHNPEQFANGFHLLGHSQGGIIGRAILQTCDDFNIINFVSISGVQAGIYGDCEEFGYSDCEALTDYFYSPEERNSYSIAQFWRSPNREKYLNGNGFLPYLNNELDYDPSLKNNTLRLKHMYLLGSESDDVITPWQASIMGFYDSDGETIVPMEKQLYYTQDTFGLRTLDKTHRLTLRNIPGLSHVDWIRNADVIAKHVIPCLED